MFFLSEGNLLTKLLLWSDDSIGRIQNNCYYKVIKLTNPYIHKPNTKNKNER